MVLESRPASMVHVLEGGELFVGQDRLGEEEAVALLFGGFEKVAFGADVALQGHDDFFADGVDGRVGDLREGLFEVVVEHARLIGEAGEGGVVAHGADGFAARKRPWGRGGCRGVSVV